MNAAEEGDDVEDIKPNINALIPEIIMTTGDSNPKVKIENESYDHSHFSSEVNRALARNARKMRSKIGIPSGPFKIQCRKTWCLDMFESPEAMEYHQATFHFVKKKVFSCYMCHKNLMTRQTLQRHMNSCHTHRIRYKCPIETCQTSFADKCDLNRHLNVLHTKQRKFECAKCFVTFYDKSRLTNHMAYYHGEGTTYCCYLCKRTLSQKISLREHMSAKHIPRTYINCSVDSCPMKFTIKGTMRRHLLEDHGKGHVCGFCKRNLSSEYRLQRHMNYGKCSGIPVDLWKQIQKANARMTKNLLVLEIEPVTGHPQMALEY